MAQRPRGRPAQLQRPREPLTAPSPPKVGASASAPSSPEHHLSFSKAVSPANQPRPRMKLSAEREAHCVPL